MGELAEDNILLIPFLLLCRVPEGNEIGNYRKYVTKEKCLQQFQFLIFSLAYYYERLKPYVKACS